mmetsp:Transcript_11407/g.27778  ORF Transcript_11407/g.27778 Transcript_11407/m.27778 type:complete len:227 (-) Transcript_11407:31-711(-)
MRCCCCWRTALCAGEITGAPGAPPCCMLSPPPSIPCPPAEAPTAALLALVAAAPRAPAPPPVIAIPAFCNILGTNMLTCCTSAASPKPVTAAPPAAACFAAIACSTFDNVAWTHRITFFRCTCLSSVLSRAIPDFTSGVSKYLLRICCRRCFCCGDLYSCAGGACWVGLLGCWVGLWACWVGLLDCWVARSSAGSDISCTPQPLRWRVWRAAHYPNSTGSDVSASQ